MTTALRSQERSDGGARAKPRIRMTLGGLMTAIAIVAVCAGVVVVVVLPALAERQARRAEAERVQSEWEAFPANRFMTSTNLPHDMELMWETSPLRGNAGSDVGPDPQASSIFAINAASRVFNTVDLTGLSKSEVIAKLGDPRTSSDSIYAGWSFWPAGTNTNALVYRFDCGSGGWEFNVLFDDEGKVYEVERRGIH
jgi:hypothetical protein